MGTRGSGAPRATRRGSASSLHSFTTRVSQGRAIFKGVLLPLLIFACARAGVAALPAGFTNTEIGGLSAPTAMAFAPDGRLFICQQGGALRVLKNGALLAAPFLNVTVEASGERGLLGVAFDPGFAANRFVYVYYTATTPTVHNRVSRFTASAANPDVVQAGSEFVLLDLENLSATNHNGGALHFGSDGKLYVAVGENAVPSNAQTLANKLGKILRLNPDGTIPADNPFFNAASGTNRAIWAMGLRNPYTFDVRRTTGDILVNDVGQNIWEEINVGAGGANYGWPTCEGLCPSPAPTPVVRPPNTFTEPVLQYGHDGVTCAITGGAFYDPASPQFPNSFVGKYFYADFCAGWIRLFDPATRASSDFATGVPNPVDLKVSADGSLWYLARASGSVSRVQYTANTPPAATITSPAAGALYSAGETINYSGAGADAEDGALPASAFTWRVDFQHDTHAHAFVPATSGASGGSFVVPDTGETSANVWYRIYLTVTDSRGATAEAFRDIFPRTSTVKLSTSPAGLQLALDSQPRADGYSELNVVGMRRTLGVSSPQSLGGAAYNFVRWSDNGAPTHDVKVPAGGARYKAVFAREPRAGEIVLSEFRIDGPAGSRDEFVELYNNTDQPVTVSTSDGSPGWALVMGYGDPLITPSPVLDTYHVIPNGTVIPARGHYLVVGSQYSLAGYGGANAAAGDAVSANDLGADYDVRFSFSGVGLFRTATRENFTNANRLDAVGAACFTHPLLVEGTGIGPCQNVGTRAEPAANYSLARKFAGGALQDTDDNAVDFRLVAVRSPLAAPTTPQGSYDAVLGAPGPENTRGPVSRSAAVGSSLIDLACKGASADPSSTCERVRETTPVANGALGSLTFRRRFTNRTGFPITRLRFRVVSLSTLGGATVGDADLRALASPDINVTLGKGATATVRGTSVEEPPAQALGGGLNSTFSVGAITLASPLAPGASVNVQFRFGVEREGVFRFAFVIEALP